MFLVGFFFCMLTKCWSICKCPSAIFTVAMFYCRCFSFSFVDMLWPHTPTHMQKHTSARTYTHTPGIRVFCAKGIRSRWFNSPTTVSALRDTAGEASSAGGQPVAEKTRNLRTCTEAPTPIRRRSVRNWVRCVRLTVFAPCIEIAIRVGFTTSAEIRSSIIRQNPLDNPNLRQTYWCERYSMVCSWIFVLFQFSLSVLLRLAALFHS